MSKTWEHLLPSSDEEVNEENLELFFKTMFERQEIWYKRNMLKLPRPWTNDPFLGQHKFCNVYRELDRGSQYLIKNVIANDKIDDIHEVIFRIILYRIYNSPETFEALGGINKISYQQFDVDDFVDKLKKLEAKGIKTLNDNAYKINTYIWKGFPRYIAYARFIVDKYKDMVGLIYDTMCNANDPRQLVNLFKIEGIGRFMSHEFYIDLCYLDKYRKPPQGRQFWMWFGEDDWTAVLPGSSVGIRLIFPSLSDSQQIKGIQVLRDIAPEYLERNGDFKYVQWNIDKKKYELCTENITCHQIEFHLCEMQKYWKMKNAVGKQRQRFLPFSNI